MSIKIGEQYIDNNGKKVEVLSNPFNYFYPYEDPMDMKEREKCVWFKDDEGNHVLTERDFLEQYKPYEQVYEAFYSYGNIDTPKQTKKRYKDDNEFLQSDECYGISFQGFQRLDFTKRERT